MSIDTSTVFIFVKPSLKLETTNFLWFIVVLPRLSCLNVHVQDNKARIRVVHIRREISCSTGQLYKYNIATGVKSIAFLCMRKRLTKVYTTWSHHFHNVESTLLFRVNKIKIATNSTRDTLFPLFGHYIIHHATESTFNLDMGSNIKCQDWTTTTMCWCVSSVLELIYTSSSSNQWSKRLWTVFK